MTVESSGSRPRSRGQLERARRVQLGMLPRTPQIPGLEIHTHYAPCDQIGGDFYDLVPVGDHQLAVVVGDVVGHGLDAALVMASAKKSVQVHSHGRSSPAEVLRVVAADLAPELPRGVFFTAFHGVIDMKAATLRFARAGHSPLLRFNPAYSPVVEEFQPAGMPIGAVPPDRFAENIEEQLLPLRPGDILVQFTDGLSEAMDVAQREYGEARLKDIISDAGDAPPDALAARILADVAAFRGGAALTDDVTLVIIRYTGAATATDPVVPAVSAGNLPTPGTSFIGRALDRRRLAEQLTGEHGSVVAITGPGGAGKTRLAIQVARELQDRFPGGCWFADCAEARTAEAVANAVARAFGMPMTGSRDPVAAVSELLRNRADLLLVADNVEQAVGSLDATLGAWNRAAPQVSVLATSRVRLGLPDEVEYPLGLLAVPPERAGVTAAEAGAFDAVKLFLERGRQARPDFDLDSDNAADVATIVRALDGLPLALELAATRLSVCSPADIVGMLDRKFELLHTTHSGVPERQRSLEAAIDFSYEQLTQAEQHAFQQLSVFHGGCLYEAAAAVVDLASVQEAPSLLDVLQGLREKSFVRIAAGARTTRFELYSTLRDYAARRWAGSARPARREALAERFVRHLVGYVEDWSSRLQGPAALDALDRLAAETENGFAAFDHAMSLDEPTLAARVILALAPAMVVRGPADQRVPRLEQARGALADLEETDAVRRLQVRLTVELSRARGDVGDWEAAADDAQMAVLAADALGDPLLRAEALLREGAILIARGEYVEAGTAFDAGERAVGDAAPPALRAEQALQRVALPLMQGATAVAMRALDAAEPVVRRLGYPRITARLLTCRGIAHAQRGEYDQAIACYTEAEPLHYELNDLRGVATLLGNHGNVMRNIGDYEGALDAFADGEAIDRDLGNTSEVARHQGNRADVLVLQERIDEAVRLCTEAIGTQHAIGNKRGEAFVLMTRGWAYARSARHTDARSDLREALALWDAVGADQPLARFKLRARLALTEHALGNRNEARRQGAIALDLASAQGIDEDHADPEVRVAWAEVYQLLEREGTKRHRPPSPE